MAGDIYAGEFVPTAGQWFNAYERRPPYHRHSQNPMCCTLAGKLRGKRAVETADCRLYLEDWWFEPVKLRTVKPRKRHK